MKNNILRRLVIPVIILAGLMVPASLMAQEKKDLDHCMEAKNALIKEDAAMKGHFENSAGYVIFPSIGKGGMGIGGATGNGIVYEKGKPVGKVNMSQLTIGAQAGGQVYREVIFFENKETLDRLKNDKFEFAAQASAVAVKSGVSANAKYREGVMVFTQEKGGLMYEATVGGQKFTYSKF